MISGRSLFAYDLICDDYKYYESASVSMTRVFTVIITNLRQMFNCIRPEPNRSLESLSKIYPRPSPYIDSNLHKFGTGPSSTMLPVQNEMPVTQRRMNLNSNQYYSKTEVKLPVCYCCLDPIDQDYINNLDKYFEMPTEEEKSSIVDEQAGNKIEENGRKEQNLPNTKSNYSQMSIMKYFGKQKQDQKAIEIQEEKVQKSPKCYDCSKLVCKQCARICHRCHRLVCKFDYREDNSLGLHNC